MEREEIMAVKFQNRFFWKNLLNSLRKSVTRLFCNHLWLCGKKLPASGFIFNWRPCLFVVVYRVVKALVHMAGHDSKKAGCEFSYGLLCQNLQVHASGFIAKN